MKSAFTIFALLLGLTALGAGIHANAGSYGYQFLDISTNPVALSLAGRGIASGADLASWMRQPASAVLESHRSLGASHSLWLEDTRFNNLYYSYSTRKNHLGLALRSLDYGELEIRDDNGELIGHYSPLNMDLTGNYALRVTPSLYAGLNAGVAYEKLNTDSSLGLHGDLGITWLPPVNQTSFSLAVRNLGISSNMNNEATRFPVSLELDLSKQFDLNNASIRVELSGIKAIDENWKAAASAELGLYGLAYLRAGYKAFYDAEGLTAGLGLRWKKIGVDYGWAAYSNELSDVHSVGLSYYF